MSGKLAGYYSEKQSKMTGTKFYATPDGQEVEITTVASVDMDSGSRFDDLQDCGEVTRFIRHGRDPDPYFQRTRTIEPLGPSS